MRRPLLFVASLTLACTAPAVVEDADAAKVATVESFRAARQRGDLVGARAFLGDDPRIWYDAHEGAGLPWELREGGRWRAWDEHFHGRTERATPWTVEGDHVWADMIETNDYFRLTEKTVGIWRGTYFFGPDGHITGFMVSPVPGAESDPGRRAEFEAWARVTHPEEAEYLMPGGVLDPTGDRAPRMRALLVAWRRAADLPPIEELE